MRISRLLVLSLALALPACSNGSSTAGQLIVCRGGVCTPVETVDVESVDGGGGGGIVRNRGGNHGGGHDHDTDTDSDSDSDHHDCKDECHDIDEDGDGMPADVGDDDLDRDGVRNGKDHDDDGDGKCDDEDSDDDGDGIPDDDDCDEVPPV